MLYFVVQNIEIKIFETFKTQKIPVTKSRFQNVAQTNVTFIMFNVLV